jgi:hypothetical protein
MDFILIEIIFKYRHNLVTIPVVRSEGLFCVLNCLDYSDAVIAYKVIDSQPVLPKHFGYGPDWKKWVLSFTHEHFGGTDG